MLDVQVQRGDRRSVGHDRDDDLPILRQVHLPAAIRGQRLRRSAYGVRQLEGIGRAPHDVVARVRADAGRRGDRTERDDLPVEQPVCRAVDLIARIRERAGRRIGDANV